MAGEIAPEEPSGLSPEQFLDALPDVPWFRHLGEPTPRDDEAKRIGDWDDWPGPKSPEVADLGLRSQRWYDDLMAAAGGRAPEVQALWDRIQGDVVAHARLAVPYDPEGDTWHGPTAAVWHAAWVAATIGGHLLIGREIPSEALAHWRWLVEGHWPCGYDSAVEPGKPVRLLVL